MRFAVDASLGKLGRQLRAAGFDTLCEHEQRHRGRFWETLAPDRVMLTRTRAVWERYSNRRSLFIRDNDPGRQIQQVVREMGLRPWQMSPFSRCLNCNTVISTVDRCSVWGHVPSYVWHHHHHFHECTTCGRIYWPGSHHRRMRRRLESIFQSKERPFYA